MQDGCDQDRRARASKPSDARCWNATCSSSFPVRSLRKAGTCSSARLALPGGTSWNPRSDSLSTRVSIPPRDNATPLLGTVPSWSATTVQWFGAVRYLSTSFGQWSCHFSSQRHRKTVPTIVPASRQNSASRANVSQIDRLGKSSKRLDLLGKTRLVERQLSVYQTRMH